MNRDEEQPLVVNPPSQLASVHDVPIDDNLSHDIRKNKNDETAAEPGFVDEAKEIAQELAVGLDDGAKQTLNDLTNQFGIRGDSVQQAQQNALAVLAAQIIASTFLGMLISQIIPFTFIWNLIPFLDYISIAVYIVCLIIVQFFKSVLVSPYPVIFFLLHSVSKIIILIYLTIWLNDFRMEVFFVNIVFLIGYMFFNIYSASQANQTADVSIKGNFFKLIIYSVVVSLFLVLFTRSSFWVWLVLTLFSLFYAFFLLLSMQRFPEHNLTYPDDLYLGAGQLDADLFLPCSFCRYLFVGLKSGELAEIVASK